MSLCEPMFRNEARDITSLHSSQAPCSSHSSQTSTFPPVRREVLFLLDKHLPGATSTNNGPQWFQRSPRRLLQYQCSACLDNSLVSWHLARYLFRFLKLVQSELVSFLVVHLSWFNKGCFDAFCLKFFSQVKLLNSFKNTCWIGNLTLIIDIWKQILKHRMFLLCSWWHVFNSSNTIERRALSEQSRDPWLSHFLHSCSPTSIIIMIVELTAVHVPALSSWSHYSLTRSGSNMQDFTTSRNHETYKDCGELNLLCHCCTKWSPLFVLSLVIVWYRLTKDGDPAFFLLLSSVLLLLTIIDSIILRRYSFI